MEIDPDDDDGSGDDEATKNGMAVSDLHCDDCRRRYMILRWIDIAVLFFDYTECMQFFDSALRQQNTK